ncbi:hypothetical protein WEN_01995 [Mycoplasma wenyonii str. Massachusetts]|uniref:Uncharacterized protein n=1 Tax=Mycoplasma wenyonii (strain Massachusetts) TaxID=1197325 RepID=I6ZJ06_MYCWM|nr:hypothetical protein [Mycoplasma wenyonii]AFN65190.1 hypothetical protein WEN_01995 [Mycoplasma wenyonii str. Massachusetts]
MFSLVGGSIHKTKTAYGCVLLLGSASVAGVAVGDSEGSWFSSLGGKISDAFAGAGGGSGSAGSAVGQQNGLQVAWQWVSDTGKSVFEWTIKPTAVAFTEIPTTYSKWWSGLKTFFGSLVEKTMYTMLFRSFHTKIKQTLSFFLAGGSERQKFIDLFKTEKLSNTLKAGKFLLGTETIMGLEVEKNVFNFLLFNWLEDPKKVTGKFSRLSDYVNRISGKSWTSLGNGGGGGGSASSSSSGDRAYKLTTETVKEYLEKEGEAQEKLWLFLMYLTVKSKIETGKSTNSLFSYFTNFLTSSPRGGSFRN